MTDQEQARAIAERITAELFVNGAGQEAERLVLTDKDGRDLGGWARIVVQRRILAALSRTADTARAQGLKAAFRRSLARPTTSTSGCNLRGGRWWRCRIGSMCGTASRYPAIPTISELLRLANGSALVRPQETRAMTTIKRPKRSKPMSSLDGYEMVAYDNADLVAQLPEMLKVWPQRGLTVISVTDVRFHNVQPGKADRAVRPRRRTSGGRSEGRSNDSTL
jgi:hypothetical protein